MTNKILRKYWSELASMKYDWTIYSPKSRARFISYYIQAREIELKVVQDGLRLRRVRDLAGRVC